jgi:hypothetical protein
MRAEIEPGDIYLIPLLDARFAYAQVLQWNDEMGYLVRVLDLITDIPAEVGNLRRIHDMFPPVFVALSGAISKGNWKKIGILPLADFNFPTFRSSNAFAPGTYEDWWVWDGSESRFIGKLPPELRS